MTFPAATDARLAPPPAIAPRTRHKRRTWLRMLVAAMAILAVLTLDLAPSLPKATAPRAEQVELVRNAANRLRDGLSTGYGDATVRMSREDLAAAAALASWVGSFGRFNAAMTKEALHLRASRRVIGPVWINLAAVVPPGTRGMPPVRLTIGRLALGQTPSRWLIAAVRQALRWRGVRVPPLDDVVRSVAIDGKDVTARVHLPLDSPLVADISGLRAKPVDAMLTAHIYCRLVAFDRRWPDRDMAVVANRAFAPNRSSLDQVEQNRAALVALGMYAASPNIGKLAGNAEALTARCATPGHTSPLLLGRDDLPKHWSLSAALAVSLGDDVGKAMGEWKELSDSRPNGSGFSFVDLSADRAGLAVARAATDPARAAATAARLRTGTADALLPVRALAMAEGLSEGQFVTNFGAIDSARFAEAKARIDRVLANTIGE